MSYAPKTLTTFQSCLPGQGVHRPNPRRICYKAGRAGVVGPIFVAGMHVPGDPFEPFEEAEYGDEDPLPWFTLHTSHPLPCG